MALNKTSEGSCKKVDRRIVRTRKAIMDAFDQLAAEKSIDKITVSAIVRTADIDRKTFYLHYSSINDLLDKKAECYLTRVFSATMERAGNDATPQLRLHILLDEVNTVIRENAQTFARIAEYVSIDMMIDLFAKALMPALDDVGLRSALDDNFEELFEARSRLRFAFSGALALYITWLKRGCVTPIESVSNLIEDIAINGFVPLVDVPLLERA